MPETMHYNIGSATRNYPDDWKRLPRRRSSSAVNPWSRTPIDSEFVEWHLSLVMCEPKVSSASEVKFRRLADEWQKSTAFYSSIMDIAMHPSYQQMIGMGPVAVPLILRCLKSEGEEPNDWFWALAAITSQNPVPQESRGNIVEMSKAWLEWGSKNGYIELD